MTTRQSKDFSVNGAQIIRAALRKLGVLDSQTTLTAAEEADALFALNLLLKEWSQQGIDIFVRQQVTLVLNPKKNHYLMRTSSDGLTYPDLDDDPLLLGATSASYIANSAFAPGSNSTMYVTQGINSINGGIWVTTTNRSGGLDNVTFPVYQGIQNAACYAQDDNGKWCGVRVTGVYNESGYERVTVSTTDTANVSGSETVSVGNPVRFAEGRIKPASFGGESGVWNRPMHILSAHRRDPYTGSDVPVQLIGENEYMLLNRKHQEGPVTNIWYQPYTDRGELHVWPTGDSTYTDLVMQCQFHASDMDSVADSPDFPVEWANALIYNLAHDLASEYGVSRQERIDLYTIGQGKLKEALDYNVENANVIITLDQSASGAR